MLLYIIRGVPGSGKSTLAKQLAPEHHYEADSYFVGDDGVYRFDRTKLSEAHAFCFRNVQKAMTSGASVIAVANTFTRHSEYSAYEELAVKMGYTVMEIICNGKFKNIHNVPENTLKNMKARFEF